MPKVREEIGRRYTTILREKKIQVFINDELVVPFEHCVWDDSRFVERKGIGRIPAIFRFDEVVGTQKRCTECTALVEHGRATCQICGSSGMRTIQERIRGWVGIQRYDDQTEFGIDLIRNGRALRIGEKAACFEFTDEFKKTIKDYPIDSIYGRIVGEVHLNHVPVDFLKQDFQRSSPEWQRAMSFLRGDSSLQPSQPGADTNNSIIFRLYQGYRRIRNFGKADMYMGFWDEVSGSPKRISREIEQEYLKRFRERQPGFYDDVEWWKLVELADKKPLEELVECPHCSSQNLKANDICQVCGETLKGKICIVPECAKTIPASAASCPYCGSSQIPEIILQWKCNVCGSSNPPDVAVCKDCGNPQGTLHPLSREHLISNANKSDDFSIEGVSIQLADGSFSSPINVITYITASQIIPPDQKNSIPLLAIKNPDSIEIFLDPSHRIFKAFSIKPEHMISEEVALFIYDTNRRLSKHQGIHSLSNLSWQVLQAGWENSLEDSPQKLRADIQTFFADIKEKMSVLFKNIGNDLFDEMDSETQRRLVDNLLGQGKDLGKLPDLRKSGQFLKYVDDKFVVELFRKQTEMFFDDGYWAVPFKGIKGLAQEVIERAQQRTRQLYTNCLEDILTFIEWPAPEQSIFARARASLTFLCQKQV